MRYPKVKPRLLNQAWDIADQIAKLDKMDDIDVFAPIILKIMHGADYRVWHLLDEQPGTFSYMHDRFYMLRRVRNSPVYHKQLFEGFTG